MKQHNTSNWYKVGLFICRLLNLLPIFHVSRDEGFDAVDSLNNLRFSLLSLPWGEKHVYLLTYSQKGSFKFLSTLRISDIRAPYEPEVLEKYEENFLNLEDDADGLKSKLRFEFLQHKNTECQNSINTLNNKVNSYIAIALVYTGLFAFLFQSILKLDFSHFAIFMWVAFGLSTIFQINVLVLIHRYLQVKGALKSKFSSFKNTPDWKLLAKSIYIDWLTAQDELWTAATLVKNIEKYFIRSILLSSLVLFSTVLYPFFQQTSLTTDKKTNTEFVLIDKEGKFSPQELLNLSKAITPDNTIVFIYSSSNSSGDAAANFTIRALNLSEQNSSVELSEELFDTKLLIAIVKETK